MCITTIEIHADKQGAQEIASTGAYHPRTEQIDIRYHFLKGKIKDNFLKLGLFLSKQQLADLLTKVCISGNDAGVPEAKDLHF